MVYSQSCGKQRAIQKHQDVWPRAMCEGNMLLNLFIIFYNSLNMIIILLKKWLMKF